MKGVEGGDHGDVGAVENSGEEIEIPENDTFSSSIIFAQPNGSRALTVGARAFFSSPLVRIQEPTPRRCPLRNNWSSVCKILLVTHLKK